MIHNAAVACEHPLTSQPVGSSLHTLGYAEPAVVGTNISFNCSQPEEVLVGPNTTTCMENGEWEPDPSEVECEG